MRFMSLRRSALCLSFLLTASCRDAQDLFMLAGALKHEYPDYRVSVSLTDGLILTDRKSTRLNSSHVSESRMPSSA